MSSFNTIRPHPDTPPGIKVVLDAVRKAGLACPGWFIDHTGYDNRLKVVGLRDNGLPATLTVYEKGAHLRHLRRLTRLVEIVESPRG